MKNKKILVIMLIILIVITVILSAVAIIILTKNNKTEVDQTVNNKEETIQNIEQQISEKVDIIDITSKTRPYAISINNTPVAVKVQTGLNKAYLVYEIPTEGNTSRLLALFKDIDEDLKIGTIRSSRHNFVDYALESDAIFIHYGWSHYAENDEKSGSINYINGLFDAPFWRENPERLASEHTAYTSIKKLSETIENKKFKTESDDTILLNYNTGDIDLSDKQGSQIANKVIIPYGANPNVTKFVYDSTTRMYNRIENDNYCIDYETKEKINTKNIIVQKINYGKCSDDYYWDLQTIGSGNGYFITNGYAVPITWKKTGRSSKTKYYYNDGTEIEVSDGRTYIEVQTNDQKLSIE